MLTIKLLKILSFSEKVTLGLYVVNCKTGLFLRVRGEVQVFKPSGYSVNWAYLACFGAYILLHLKI